MANRNADVNLIVRARTEGEKSISSLGDILEDLLDNARGGTGDIAALGASLGALDKAAAAIAGSMDKAGGAVDRQRASIAESNAAYTALLRQQAEAQRVLGSFGDQGNKDFVGPRTKQYIDQYAGVRAEVQRLDSAIENLFAKIGQQNAQLNGTQSALLKLSATSGAVAQGQAEAEAQIELTTVALREQAAAAERVTEIQQRINAATGVNRPSATGSAAGAADILAAADAEFRRKEAAEQEAIALRQVNNVLAERANLEATLERNTGLGRVRATDAGAGFSALAERERLAAEDEAERDLAASVRATNSALAERAQIEAALERNTGLGRGRATDYGATYSALTELVNKEHEAALAFEQMDREAAQLRSTLDPLAAIQDRFNAQLARFKELATAGKISARELAAAEDHLADQAERARAALANVDGGGGNGRGANGKIGLFGLKPYELQNLSYQVNDVVTGLASGQHATQIIAQQGGQILQLFPKVAGQVIGALANPAIAATVGVVIAIGLGMKEAADQASRLRENAAQTTFRADGGTYDPKGLVAAEEGLERIGAKAKDAQAAVRIFLTEGINPDLFTQFGRAAQETAELLGTTLPEAAQQLATAFTGGFDAIAELDNKLNFLTASEREHIKQLFAEGNANAARTEALNAYTRQADAAAAKQRGPWGEAARSLGNAWDALMKFIANSAPIRATIFVLDKLAGAVKGVADAITESLGDEAPQANTSASNIARVQAQIATLKKSITDYEAAIANKSPIAGTLRRVVEASKQQLAATEAELRRLERTATDTSSDDPNGVDAKRRTERLSQIDAEQQLQALRQRGQAGLNAADGSRRAQLAGELAYRQEMASTGDAIVAARLREIAVAKEQGEIDKANDAARRAAKGDREREIKQFEGRVIGAEGGAGKNPHGSAQGYGQFIDKTFLNQFGQVFPAQARQFGGGTIPSRSNDPGAQQILALRQNETVARAIIDNYARVNAKFLESFGAKVTAGNLYLAHFLGGGGAKAILTAPGDKAVDQIIAKLPNAAKVLSGNQGYLRTEGGKGRYRTSSELQAFIANRVGDTGQPQTQGQVAINNLIDDAKQKQDAFNQSLQHTAEDRQAALDALRAEAGLQGNVLLAEQRRQLVAQAELDLRQKAEDANRNLKPGETPVIVSQEQIDKAKELAGALFDVQHARDALTNRLNDAQRPLDQLEQQRDLLVDQRDLLQSMGEFKGAAAIDEQIVSLGGSLQDAYDKLIQFYEALSPEDRVRLGILDTAQLDLIIEKLGVAKATLQQWGKVLGIEGRQVAQAFAGAAASAFTSFINRVATGKNVFQALGASVREFGANFISSIAQALAQLLAFAAAVQVLRALGVPIPASFGVGQHHTGGIVGASAGSVQRTVAPEMFAAAMRYHNGGIAGFAPDEVPAILKRNEEVLTAGDPRHRFNGGGAVDGKAASPRIKIVNTFDSEDAAQQILNTRTGEKAVLNLIRTNSRAVKAALA